MSGRSAIPSSHLLLPHECWEGFGVSSHCQERQIQEGLVQTQFAMNSGASGAD